jgi:hypothetical protein
MRTRRGVSLVQANLPTPAWLRHPPDDSPGLSLHGARTLARLLRNAAEIPQARVVAAVGQSHA